MGDFVSLMLKGRTDGFALKGGDATHGNFATMYDGPRPIRPHQKGKKNHGYQPMKKEGGIILGTGGDESNGAQGNFYEGFMATGPRQMPQMNPCRPISLQSVTRWRPHELLLFDRVDVRQP